MIQKAIMLVIVFIAAPYLFGILCEKLCKKKEESLPFQYMSGQLVQWALFELLVLPGIYLGWFLHRLVWVYGAVIAILCVISCILHRRVLWKTIKKSFRFLIVCGVPLWMAVLLFFAQAGYSAQKMHLDDDDAFYVATAETAVTTDSLMQFNPYTGKEYASFPARYVLSPFPLYIAAQSVVIGVKPVILAHTVYPILILGMVYMILYLLGTILFSDKKQIGYFLFMAGIVLQYSGYSIYTQGAFLFFRSWQGKAVLAAVLLPAVLYYSLRLIKKEPERMDYGYLLLLMLSCCLVSSMGIMLGAIALGLCAIAYIWETRDLKPAFGMLAACLPNVVLSVLYLCIR